MTEVLGSKFRTESENHMNRAPGQNRFNQKNAKNAFKQQEQLQTNNSRPPLNTTER